MNKFTFFFAFLSVIAATCLQAQNTRTQPHAPASRNPSNPAWIYPAQDVTPPVISCLNNLSANLLATDMVQLYTSDILLAASDDVTPFDQLKFGIRKTGTGSGFPVDANNGPIGSIIFDCDEQGNQPVELWVMDQAGNTAFCTTSIGIQDNYNHCTSAQGISTICIGNHICAVDEVYFDVNGANVNGDPFSYFISEEFNCTQVSFPDSSSGTIKPVKDDNPLNGVTSYDLQLIKQHILGNLPFTSPYQYIAADINRDGEVTGLDTLELRKLILGIYQELPDNTSWRFVRADYQFPADPLSQPFPETVSFDELNQLDTVRFIPIKIGDVNGTAVCNTLVNPDDRSAEGALIEAQVLPNPTDGNAFLIVTLTRPEVLQINLYDIAGKQVLSHEFNAVSGQNRIEIPAAAMKESGVYVWQMIENGRSSSGKLIRE